MITEELLFMVLIILLSARKRIKANCGCGVMTNDVIQLREELSDQINALKGMKAMALCIWL